MIPYVPQPSFDPAHAAPVNPLPSRSFPALFFSTRFCCRSPLKTTFAGFHRSSVYCCVLCSGLAVGLYPLFSATQVWVARNPPGFAFVWFGDERDATDAVREIDGRSIGGREWRVEIVSTTDRYLIKPALNHGISSICVSFVRCCSSRRSLCLLPGGGCLLALFAWAACHHHLPICLLVYVCGDVFPNEQK